MIENSNCRLEFLLRYSLDFNPIEHSLACLKRELKSGNYMLDNEDRVLFAGGVSSLAVCSALVASFHSPRENTESRENRPVGENGENKPVGKKSSIGKNGRTYPSRIASPDEHEGQCITALSGDAQK